MTSFIHSFYDSSTFDNNSYPGFILTYLFYQNDASQLITTDSPVVYVLSSKYSLLNSMEYILDTKTEGKH